MLAPASDRDEAVSPGYRVIKSLEIKNFRCFSSETLLDIGRVNVIVGENGAGKTTLLESLFLLGGNSPDLTVRMRAQRGMGNEFTVAHDRKVMEEIWRDLFFDSDMDIPINISITESDGPTRSVVVQRSTSGMQAVLPLKNGRASLSAPVEFIWRVGSSISKASMNVSSDGLAFANLGNTPTLPLSYFYSTVVGAAPAEAAGRFSELSKNNGEDAFIASVRALYPMVRGLSVQTNSGTVMLYAKVHGTGPKIPLAVVSQGINKVVQLLLGIEDAQDGIVLVDELDSGIYYRHLPDVWTALLSAARRVNAQLFITTLAANA